MAGNRQLEVLMMEAGFLKDDGSVGLKVFARAVGRAAGREFQHTYVRRWLDGMVPRDKRVRAAIVEALGQRLGRRVTLEEVGFAEPAGVPRDVGLAYPTAADDGITALASLWRADMDGLPGLLTAPVDIGAWNEASLSWLVSARHDATSRTGSRHVSAADVEGVRLTVEQFDALDGQLGGGHARTSLVQFLRTDLAALLHGSYGGAVGADLFKAGAQATLLGAWMTYDAGIHGLAQRYFIQALSLADTADDRLLGASILDAMSHQATFLGRFKEAANLARAARTGTERAGSPSAAAHFYAMEARALARLGDTAGCDRAMSGAVREFERRDPLNDPAQWFGYFNESELAAELGHCNRDLGRSGDATAYATQSLGPVSSGYVRSDFFATMVLADAHLDQGDLEQACKVAFDALEIGERLKSARCAAYVDEFQQRLSQVGPNRVASDFQERASTTRLWTPSSARTGTTRAGRRRT